MDIEKMRGKIDSYLIKRITQEGVRGKSSKREYKDDVFHASSSGTCLKKIVLNRYYPEVEPPKSKQRFFGYAWILHGGLEKVFKEFAERMEGVEVRTEVQLEQYNEDVTIVGSPDIILKTNKKVKIFGRTIEPDESIIDIKTTKNLKYNKQNFKENHIMQLQVYMWLMGIEKAFLIVVNRENGKMLFQGPIYYNIDEVDDIFDKFRKAYNHIKNETVLDINPTSKSRSEQWKCDYCRYYQKRCFEEK